jgi:hypothetical protein
MLNHLALVIDLTENRLEKATVPFLRAQLVAQLDKLFARFDAEYLAFLQVAGQSHPMPIPSEEKKWAA